MTLRNKGPLPRAVLKKHPVAVKSKAARVKLPQPSYTSYLSELHLLGISLLLIVAFYTWSRVSNGFYQNEEGAQYINMLDFWRDWKVILGNWAKTGWKLLYVFPALLGPQVVIFLNCLLSAFTAYFVYKVCALKNIKVPFTGVLMLLTQLLWFQLSHRTYSELLTAFLLILSVYFYYRNKLVLSIILFSYILTVRQEFYPIALVYGVYLCCRKKFLLAALLGLAPLLYMLAGYIATKDLFYLFNEAGRMTDYTRANYPKQGFDHYFKVAPLIFGTIPLTFFIIYVALCSFKKIRPDWLLLVCAGLFFFIHCFFNWKSLTIGASTGGNWRYMTVLSPIIAVLAATGFDHLSTMENKWKLLYFLVPYLYLVLKFTCFHHNWIKLEPDSPDPFLFLFAILALVLALLPVTAKRRYYYLLILSAVYLLVMLRPIKLKGENLAMKEACTWAKQNKIAESRHILSCLPLFNYYYNKRNDQFPHKKEEITPQLMKNAPRGSYIFWDTHYATKYGKVDWKMCASDSFRAVRYWVDDERIFSIVLLEKVK